MQGVSELAVFTVALYILLLFLLSAFFIKKVINSYEEFSYCGRSLTLFFIFSTYLGTWIGGGTIIGLSSWAYASGVSRYWIFSVPYFFGFFFALLFIRKIRRNNLGSVTELFVRRFPHYEGIIRLPVIFSILLRNVTMVGMQFSALSYFVMYGFGISRNLAILIIFIILTGYTCLSGLWGVVATDLVQGFLQTLGLVLLFYFSVKVSGGFGRIVTFYENLDIQHHLNLVSTENWWQEIGRYLLPIGIFFLIGDQGD